MQYIPEAWNEDDAPNVIMEGDVTWRKVRYAGDCGECEMCGEPWCELCEEHYADCECPGPHQDDVMEYKAFDGVEYATPLPEEVDYGPDPETE